MKPPCKDCPDRQVGCHGKCGKYAEFSEERARIREMKRLNSSVSSARDAAFQYAERRFKVWKKNKL